MDFNVYTASYLTMKSALKYNPNQQPGFEPISQRADFIRVVGQLSSILTRIRVALLSVLLTKFYCTRTNLRYVQANLWHVFCLDLTKQSCAV